MCTRCTWFLAEFVRDVAPANGNGGHFLVVIVERYGCQMLWANLPILGPKAFSSSRVPEPERSRDRQDII